MAEKEERTEFEYTYTYDQFTVFFYGERVFIGKKDYPVGQCCVDILNLDDALFDEIDQRVKEFVPAAQNLLTEKTNSAAALAQERLNAVWELIFNLPVYRDLKMDEPCNYHMFQRLMADEEKWAQVQDPTSDGYTKYQGLTAGYNTCYCNNIAPGETARTCRKVGSHRKEAQGKGNRTPAQKEYDRTYNRLKVKKQRGKISKDEWNAAMAKAQGLVAQSGRGELSDDELKQKLEEF